MLTERTQTPSKIVWITGLKGLACYGVFLHHLFLGLIPDTFYGTAPSGTAWLFSSSPIGVLINGNFFVFIFLTLSGYLIGKSFINYNSHNLGEKISKFCVKRYFRLMLPILAYGILRHILMVITNALWEDCPLKPYPNLLFVIKHCVRDVFICNDIAITGTLWMINHLFLGSYIAMLLAIPDRKTAKRYLAVLYIVALALVLKSQHCYLAAVVLGVMLNDLQILFARFFEAKRFNWICKILILIGIFLGGVPSTSVSNPFFLYRHLISRGELWHCFGAFLLLLGILGEYIYSNRQDAKSTIIIKTLESAPLQFMGKISFAILLMQEIPLVLLSNNIRNLCITHYGLSTAITATIAVVVVSAANIFLSWLFYSFVEKYTNKLCNRIG